MTTNVEAEVASESKANTPLKEQIKWNYMVVLIFTNWMALYAAVVVVPRVSFSSSLGVGCVWSVCYTPTHVSKESS